MNTKLHRLSKAQIEILKRLATAKYGLVRGMFKAIPMRVLTNAGLAKEHSIAFSKVWIITDAGRAAVASKSRYVAKGIA
jgi:hypothetical protein